MKGNIHVSQRRGICILCCEFLFDDFTQKMLLALLQKRIVSPLHQPCHESWLYSVSWMAVRYHLAWNNKGRIIQPFSSHLHAWIDARQIHCVSLVLDIAANYAISSLVHSMVSPFRLVILWIGFDKSRVTSELAGRWEALLQPSSSYLSAAPSESDRNAASKNGVKLLSIPIASSERSLLTANEALFLAASSRSLSLASNFLWISCVQEQSTWSSKLRQESCDICLCHPITSPWRTWKWTFQILFTSKLFSLCRYSNSAILLELIRLTLYLIASSATRHDFMISVGTTAGESPKCH